MMSKLRKNKVMKTVLAIGVTLSLIVGIFATATASVEAAVVYGSYTNYQRAAIYYTYTQNKNTCKTTLEVRLRVYASKDHGTFKYDAPWSLTYNGTTKTGTKDYDCPAAGKYRNISSLYSKSITQTNGAAKDIKISGWINLSGTSVGKKLSVSKTITLPAFQPSTTYASSSVSGKIVWDDGSNRDGKQPSSVTVTLYRNGSAYKTATISKGTTTFSWSGLYKYASGGSAYTYTVGGSDVTGYTKTVSGTTITYKHTPETKTVSGSIVWDDDSNRDGKRPSSVTVTLYKNGSSLKTATVSSTNNTFSFPSLYTYEGGSKVSYTVKSSAVTGYTASVSGTVITLKHTPEKVNISGGITWSDDNNSGHIRPSVVEITLLKNGTAYDSVVVKEADSWNFDFGSFNKYEDGKEIKYTLKVPTVTDYEHKIKGYDITYSTIGKQGTVFGFSI